MRAAYNGHSNQPRACASRNPRHGLPEWPQVCSRHVMQTFEHLDTD